MRVIMEVVRKKNIKLSIIVPIFNTKKYLADCLLSLFDQDMENYEVLLIDDGSTDGSSELAQQFAQKYPAMQYHYFDNRGVSVARNRGIALSSGEYILFVDSDDRLLRNGLSKMLKIIEENKLDCYMFSASVLCDGPEYDTEALSYRRRNKGAPGIKTGRDEFTDQVENDMFSALVTLFVVHKTMIKSLRFYPGIIHEDNLFTVQLLLSENVSRVLSEDKPYYQRRIRPSSIMQSEYSNCNLVGYMVVFKELRDITLENLDARQSAAITKFTRGILHFGMKGIVENYSVLSWRYWYAHMAAIKILFSKPSIILTLTAKDCAMLAFPKLYDVIQRKVGINKAGKQWL